MGKWHKSILANVMFAIIGIGLILGGAVWLMAIGNFKKTAVKTEAVITSIKIYEDSDGDTQYDTIAEFTVDGVPYSGYIGHVSGMKEGQVVTVYYNPDDPQEFQDSADPIIAVVFICVGILFAFVGFFPVIYKLIPDNKKRRV